MRRLWLFGPLDAQQNDRALQAPAGKPRELLACLALCDGRRLTRDALAGLLYADYSAAHARRGLVNALHRLRRSLGEGWLRISGDTISLEADSLWVDVWEFEASAAIAPAQALQLYRGDLAEDIDADWILSDRMRLRDRCLLILESECRRLLERHDYHATVGLAQRWVAIEPLSEEACCVLMRACAQLGCFDLALRQYERLAADLAAELGQRPSALTNELARAFTSAREARMHSDVSAFLIQFERDAHANLSLTQPRARAHLVRNDVPLGRPLQEQDYVDVWWTIDSGDEDAAILRQAGPVALRRHRLRRLILEARGQGALPTHDNLAQALHVCARTIARDLNILKVTGTRKKHLPVEPPG